MKKWHVFVFLVVNGLVGFSQKVDSIEVIEDSIQEQLDTVKFERLTKFPLFSLTYTNYSISEYEATNGRGSIQMEEFHGSLQFAIKIKEKKTYMLNRADFTQFQSIGTSSQSTSGFNENFYSFAYSIGMINILKNRWKVVTILTPTFASDFKNKVSTDDLVFQAYVNVSKRATRYFEYGFGMAFTTRFGRELALPIVSATYRKDNWSLFAILPVHLSGFRHFENSKLGLTFSANGSFYNFQNDINPYLELDKVGYSRINLGPEYEVKLYKAAYLNLKAGVTLRNKLEPQDNQGKIELDLSTKDKMFFSAGLNILF